MKKCPRIVIDIDNTSRQPTISYHSDMRTNGRESVYILLPSVIVFIMPKFIALTAMDGIVSQLTEEGGAR